MLEGNPGKRKTKTSPEPSDELPSRPGHLTGRAAKVWDELAEELNRLGLLTMIDAPGFAELCSAVALSEKAQAKLEEMGEVVEIWGEDDEGDLYVKEIRRNPWIMVKKQAVEVIVRIMAEFGMTPSSRGRVSAGKKKSRKNPLEQWLLLQGGKGAAKTRRKAGKAKS